MEQTLTKLKGTLALLPLTTTRSTIAVTIIIDTTRTTPTMILARIIGTTAIALSTAAPSIPVMIGVLIVTAVTA